jgi:hypothetical protein
VHGAASERRPRPQGRRRAATRLKSGPPTIDTIELARASSASSPVSLERGEEEEYSDPMRNLRI